VAQRARYRSSPAPNPKGAVPSFVSTASKQRRATAHPGKAIVELAKRIPLLLKLRKLA